MSSLQAAATGPCCAHPAEVNNAAAGSASIVALTFIMFDLLMLYGSLEERPRPFSLSAIEVLLR
jgi:hypothetical protein